MQKTLVMRKDYMLRLLHFNFKNQTRPLNGGIGAKRDVSSGSSVNTGAKFPVDSAELAHAVTNVDFFGLA